jgi:hypothetical protein
MEIAFVILIVSLVLNGMSEAFMDKIQFHYHTSVFKKLNPLFWNPELSWKNKYKSDLKTPRFFGSTTFFVSLTDGWHLMKLVFNLTLAVALFTAFSSVWYWIAVLLVIRRIVFEVTFRALTKKD